MSNGRTADESLLAEVVRRLQETEQRAGAVISALERQKSLKSSLTDARNRLGNAASGLTDLSGGLHRATGALERAVEALRSATDVLRQADPAVVASRLDVVQEQAGRIEQKCGGLEETIGAEHERVRRAVGAVAGDVAERLTPVIAAKCNAAAEEVVKTLRDHIDAARTNTASDIAAAGDQRLRVLGLRVGSLEPRRLVEGIAGRRKG